ncbi:unnamed protein product, partial [Brassica oleracea]
EREANSQLGSFISFISSLIYKHNSFLVRCAASQSR